MYLKNLNYSQYADTSAEWTINNFTFNKINLLVGKNAVGKTRTLNVINGLASLLSDERKIQWDNGRYDVSFSDTSLNINYELKYADRSIIVEKLEINGKNYMTRGEDGKGVIEFHEENKKLKFQTPPDEVAAFSRRDSIQHPFLEYLYNWGNHLVKYRFGRTMGQDSFLIYKNLESIKEINIKNTEDVVRVFIAGNNRFDRIYSDTILDDMKQIGYNLEEINLKKPAGVTIQSNIPIDIISDNFMGISVKEKDRNEFTHHDTMSQGMFRALSLFIQLNYFIQIGEPGTILIDDIGEGLDYERSVLLIKSIIKKVTDSDIQLIMATNDQFIMNNVPIEYWIVLVRDGGNCFSKDYRNSKDIFDDFDFTGLSNFDFFSSNYYQRSD